VHRYHSDQTYASRRASGITNAEREEGATGLVHKMGRKLHILQIKRDSELMMFGISWRSFVDQHFSDGQRIITAAATTPASVRVCE